MVNANHSAAIAWRASMRRGCGILLFLSLYAVCRLPSTGLAQQPQTSAAPVFAANAKYVQGVGPGYWPTAGSGLNLNLAAGSAFCGNPPGLVNYAGGTLTMAASQTNYVYLDPAAGCAPASNTTGFSVGHIPLAKVVTGASSIPQSGITDARNWFTPLPCTMDSSGGVKCSALGTNQDITLAPSGTGKLSVVSGGGIVAEFTGANNGGGFTGFRILGNAAGVKPYLSLETTTGTYFGDIEANTSNGLNVYSTNYMKLAADGGIDIQAGQDGSDQNLSLHPGGAGNVFAKRFNRLRFAERFAGADAGAKIAACLADPPSTGGTCDARGLEGTQTISGNVFAGIVKPVRLLLGHVTLNIEVTQLVATHNITVEGQGATTLLNFTGTSGNVLQFGSSGSEVSGTTVRNLKIVANESTKAAAINGLIAYVSEGLTVEDVIVEDSEQGITVFGSGVAKTKARLTRYRVKTADGHGISFGAAVSDSVIAGSDVEDSNNFNLGAGIFIASDAGSGNRVTNNTVRSSGDNGIRIQASDVVVAGNSVSGSATDGFRYEGDRIVSSGNLSQGNTQYGFKVATSAANPALTDVLQSGDLAYNNTQDGFYWLAADTGHTMQRIQATGCIASGNAQSGFRTYSTGASGLSDFLFVGNTSAANTARGFNIDQNSVNGTVGPNFIRDNTAGAYAFGTGVSGVKLTDNNDADGAVHTFRSVHQGQAMIDMDSGSTSKQDMLIRFLSLSATKWQLGYSGTTTPVDAFQIRDLQDSGAFRLLFVKGAETELNTRGTGAVTINSRANSGTGGLQIWSGGASPTNTAFITGNGAAVFALNTVTFSATPTFDASLGNTQKITLTNNVTSSTLSNASAGQEISFIICQDATGERTFVWPTNVKGGMTIGLTASKCSAQSFKADSSGNAYATSSGVANM